MHDLRFRIAHFLELLVAEEQFDEAEGLWLFCGGGQCSMCTDSAQRIATRFKGMVVGYYSRDNPRAAIGLPEVDGHDFALIDKRWLVDYWAWRVSGISPKPILDLSNAADRIAACVLYGPANVWELVEFTQAPSDRIA